jgi:hypothetical protein
MLRKAGALILLLIFLTGSTGFSLTYHFCAHSGSTYIGSFGIPAHNCEKEKVQATLEKDCCHKEEPKKETSCCSSTGAEKEETCTRPERPETHSCCNDQHTLLKIKHVVKSVSVTAPMIAFPLELPVHSALQVNPETQSVSFLRPEARSPDDPVPDLNVLNSVFRI